MGSGYFQYSVAGCMELSRAFLVATLASLAVGAAVGIVYLLLGDFGSTQRNLLLTTMVAGGFSLTGWASAARSGSWWMWPLRPLGAATSTVALVVVVLRIWGLVEPAEGFWRVLITLTVLAFTLAHLSLLLGYRPASGLLLLCRAGAMVAAAALAVLIFAGIWGYLDTDPEGLYPRLLGVVGILDLSGTLALFPLSRLGGSSEGAGGQAGRRARPLRSARQR